MFHAVSDWDDAYANMPNIPGGEAYPDRWLASAAAFRERLDADGRAETDIAYGAEERQRYDLFMPEDTPRGLFVFVHGGYWMRFDKTHWSHLAAGPLAHGFAVAMPAYRLCPQVRIADITRDIATAIAAAAARVDGPVQLAGHSAGGHLVTRMVCEDSPLEPALQARIAGMVSISGVHDLRPLMQLELNATLQLDEHQALRESPALLRPVSGTRLAAWVGGGERAEFLRQNALIANVWRGLGAATLAVEEPDRHHFNVVEGLCDRDHALTRLAVDSGRDLPV